MKFTTVLISALAAVTAVAAVPVQYDDSPVFARSDDGELFVRYDDVMAILEARGKIISKIKGDDKLPSYNKAIRAPLPPSYEQGDHPNMGTAHTHTPTDYSDNRKSATGHNSHHHHASGSGSGSRSGRR